MSTKITPAPIKPAVKTPAPVIGAIKLPTSSQLATTTKYGTTISQGGKTSLPNTPVSTPATTVKRKVAPVTTKSTGTSATSAAAVKTPTGPTYSRLSDTTPPSATTPLATIANIPTPTPTSRQITDSKGNVYTVDSNNQIVSGPSTGGDYQVGSQYVSPQDAAKNVLNTLQTPAQQQATEEQVYQSKLTETQGLIDSINEQYASELSQQGDENKRQELETNVQSLLGGMSGSAEAGGAMNTTKAAGLQANQAILANKAKDVATVLNNIRQEASSQAQTEIATERGSAQDIMSMQSDNLAKGQAYMKSIASSGVDLTKLQESNPTEYNHLLSLYGGDENAMKADYVVNGSANWTNSDKPIISGSKLIYYNAQTGKSLTIDTGTDLSDGKNTVVSKDNSGIYITNKVPNADGTYTSTKIGGTGNPLYAANQVATLASKNAMLVSRYGTAVNNITKQLFPQPANNPLSLYSNSLNYTTKLNEAFKLSTAKDNADKGPADLELIDAAVKINNGGQQITETQINSLFKSLNIGGKATIEGGKLIGISSLLTDGQRNAIKTLAEANIKAQGENAQNATKIISERAIRAGVPANMLSTPDDIMALSAAVDSGTGAIDTSTLSEGATAEVTLGDGSTVATTYNPADGNFYDDTGNAYDSNGDPVE